MATISTRDAIRGSPFANVFSISDGTSLKVSGRSRATRSGFEAL